MVEHIKKEVNKLIEKYNTNNPYEIARYENIIVTFEPLGTINGYYNKYVRQNFIHINSELNDCSKCLTCCHELGHIILHPNINTPFLRECTFFSTNKLEYQANIFAVELFVSDTDIKKYCCLGYSISQISKELGICEPLIEYKIKNIAC